MHIDVNVDLGARDRAMTRTVAAGRPRRRLT
jgi:hypothetical protein